MIDFDFLPIFLEEAAEILEQWESCCLSLERSPQPDTLSALFRCAHNLKGSAKSVGLEAFSSLVHEAEDLITHCKNVNFYDSTSVSRTLLDCQYQLATWIEGLRSDSSFRLPSEHEAKIKKELSKHYVKVEIPQPTKSSDFEIFESEMTSPEKQQEPQAHSEHTQTIRVPIQRIDNMIRLMGELSIQHSIVRNARDKGMLGFPQISEAITLAHKAIQDLQFDVMALRMQPLQALFQRMERVAVDTARAQKKAVRVLTKGSDVELDKNVIEKMKDPLTHILRNAVDHGIESKEQRSLSGKDPVATITIQGGQSAANVTIKISDDGIGLNTEKILKKMLDLGFVKKDDPIDEYNIHQAIFLPGFSTADKVTDISGRGVGMDVVKKAVDDLNGSIAIESQRGKGTTFTITLPSTLSILDAIIINLSDALYAVPVQDIDEVVDLSSYDIQSVGLTSKAINLRGQIIPLTSLGSLLPAQTKRDSECERIAIISRSHGTSLAFSVDSLEGQQSIVVRQLEENLANTPEFSGGTILANGFPSMILKLEQIVRNFLTVN